MSNTKLQDQKLKECTYFIDGMHCASCEILIEKKLLKEKGIESVDASLKDNKVEIVYKGSEKPEIWKLDNIFKSSGYRFSDKKIKKKNKPLVQINSDGTLTFNKKKLISNIKIIGILFSLGAFFIFFEQLKLGKYVSVDNNSALTAFILLGLVAGVSSCAALIGGLLLSMTKQWHELYIESESNVEKSLPHLMFHSGRLLSFFLLGGILGVIGEKITLNNTLGYSVFVFILSLIMIVLSLQMLGVEWAQNFSFRAPKSFIKFAADENNFKSKYMPFVTGFLTFLLPCGFTLIAQTIALTSGSFLRGGLVMLFFALGTFPMLLAISISSIKFNSRPHLTAKFNVIAGIVIIFFAIYNINGQLNVLGLPSLNDIISKSEQNLDTQPIKADESGVQVLKITAKDFDYIPTTSTTLKAGVSTKLIVDNQGIQGCGNALVAYGLTDKYFILKNGMNEIDLGKPKKGEYKISCTMGMVPPVVVKVI